MLYTALLVDDDATNNFINETLLAESGRFEPLVLFSDPGKAHAYVKTNCLPLKAHSLANLMLIDINMPDIDGFELTKDLKEACPAIVNRTIMCILTTSSHEKDINKAKELGIGHYLQKPLTKKDIDYLITLLEQKHP